MEAALCLRSNQTLTKRPLRDPSSINRRRNTLSKHLIRMPIAAHSQRWIASSRVNPTPSVLLQSPSPPEVLKFRNASAHAAGSGLRWSRASTAGLMLACALAGATCVKLARASSRPPPCPGGRVPKATNESPILRTTRTTLSQVLLAQKSSLAVESTLRDLFREYGSLPGDLAGILNLPFRNFPENEVDYRLRLLLVNIYIATKEYQKAKQMCKTLLHNKKDARPRLQMVVIDMMLALEKMLEPKPQKRAVIEKIETAKESWKSYIVAHKISGKIPDDEDDDDDDDDDDEMIAENETGDDDETTNDETKDDGGTADNKTGDDDETTNYETSDDYEQ